MGRKRNKRKLTDDQKRWLKNLQDYVASPFFKWTGDQDLKDAVEGKFAVFHADVSKRYERDPRTKKMVDKGYMWADQEWSAFDVVVGADDYPGAEAVVKMNPSPRLLIVDLESLETLKDVKKDWK